MKKIYKMLSMILVLVLGVGIVFTVGACEFFGNDNKNELITKPTESLTVDTECQSGTSYPLPSNLMFTTASVESTTASEGITLTANVSPSNATNKLVDWTVEFVNPTHEWATGKTASDYVTVTPTTSGSLNAVVKCLQAFGSQIKIVVTSRSNTNAKAECNVDYVARIEDVKMVFIRATNAPVGVEDTEYNTTDVVLPAYYEDGKTISYYDDLIGFKEVYSVGTIMPTFSSAQIAPNRSDEFITALENSYFDTLKLGQYSNYIVAQHEQFTNSSREDCVNLIPYSVFIQQVLTNYPSGVEDFSLDEFMNLLNQSENTNFKLDYTVNFENNTSLSVSFDCSFDTSALAVLVDSITLNDGSIIF